MSSARHKVSQPDMQPPRKRDNVGGRLGGITALTAATLPFNPAPALEWRLPTASFARWSGQQLINVGYYGGRFVATGLVAGATGGAIGLLAGAAANYAYEMYQEIVRLDTLSGRFTPDWERIENTVAAQGMFEPTAVTFGPELDWVKAFSEMNWDWGPNPAADFIQKGGYGYETVTDGILITPGTDQSGRAIGDRSFQLQFNNLQPNWPDRRLVIPYGDLEIGIGTPGEYPNKVDGKPVPIPASAGKWITDSQIGRITPWYFFDESKTWEEQRLGNVPEIERVFWRGTGIDYGSRRQFSPVGVKPDVLLPPIPISVYLPSWLDDRLFLPLGGISPGVWPKRQDGSVIPGVVRPLPTEEETPIPTPLPLPEPLPGIPPTVIRVAPSQHGIRFDTRSRPGAKAEAWPGILQHDVKVRTAAPYLAALRFVNQTFGKATEVLDFYNAFRWNLRIAPVKEPIVVYPRSVRDRDSYYRVTIRSPQRLGELPMNAQVEVLKRIALNDPNVNWQLDIDGMLKSVLQQEIEDLFYAAATKAERTAMTGLNAGLSAGPLDAGNISTWVRRSHGWLN